MTSMITFWERALCAIGFHDWRWGNVRLHGHSRIVTGVKLGECARCDMAKMRTATIEEMASQIARETPSKADDMPRAIGVPTTPCDDLPAQPERAESASQTPTIDD